MGLRDQKTRFVNETDEQINFKVARGNCPLHGLAAGETHSVKLSAVHELNRNHKTPDWEIFINNESCGKTLDSRKHVLGMTDIVLRFKSVDGSRELTAEGVEEYYLGRIFRHRIHSKKRIPIKLDLDAESRKKTARKVEHPNIVVAPLIGPENSLQLRDIEHPDIVAAPLITHENSLQSRKAAPASAGKRRDHDMIADLRRRDHDMLVDLRRRDHDMLADLRRRDHDMLADLRTRDHDMIADLRRRDHDMLVDLRRRDHDMLADLRRRDHDMLADLRRRDHVMYADLRRRDHVMLVDLRWRDTFNPFFFCVIAFSFVAFLWLRYKS